MIDTKNCAKYEVKEADRQNSLPKTDKMESKWYSLECVVSLNSAKNLRSCWFWFKNRENAGLYTIKHARIDIIRSNSSEMYIGFHLL